MFIQTVSYSTAFFFGLLSFLSPCVLPLIPAYFSFITGLSLNELLAGNTDGIRAKVFFSTLSFVCGFSLLFILLGATASSLGKITGQYQGYIRIIGGVIIFIFGIHLLGIFRIHWLDVEKRIHLEKKPLHFLGAFMVGMAFGAGWSPCTGPLLGPILLIAGSKETIREGIILLSIYSAGLALPFILISFFINFILEFMHWASRFLKYANRVAGTLLIIVGILMITDSIQFFSSFFV